MSEAFSEEIHLPELPPALPPLAPRGLFLGLALMAAGMLLMAVVGVFELRWLSGQPWSTAVIVSGRTVDAEDAIPVWIRGVSREVSETGNPFLDELQAAFDAQDLGIKVFPDERVIMADVPEEMLARLTASGRPPIPGRAEVLAGDMALDAPFVLDGVSFNVVGRLHQGVSGFPFVYLIPRHPEMTALFEGSPDARQGALVELGLLRLDELFGSERDDEEAFSGAEESTSDITEAAEIGEENSESADTLFLGGRTRTTLKFSWLVFAAMMLTAYGGALAHISLFSRYAGSVPGILRPALRAIAAHPVLFIAMHLLLYGCFFGAMAQGIAQPVLNYRAADYMGSVFTEGGLSYIGEAYASGRIAWAAAATFFNNYVVQTLGLTFGISVVPAALGILKNIMSFLMVGFVMAPVWTGTASGYSFHCVTMVLELEAYIVACFVVALWTKGCFHAMNENRIIGGMWENIVLYGSGAVLAGLMLALAAFYEAATLILLH